MSLWGPSFSEPQVVRENSACVWKAIWQTNPCGNGLTPRHSRLLPLSPLPTPRPVIPGRFVILGNCFSGLHSLASRARFRHHSLSLDAWTKFQWPSSVAPPLGSTPHCSPSSIIRGYIWLWLSCRRHQCSLPNQHFTFSQVVSLGPSISAYTYSPSAQKAQLTLEQCKC